MLRSAIARRSLQRTLESQTHYRIDRRRVIVPARVVGRGTDGLAQLVALDGECSVRAEDPSGEAVGDVVTVPTGVSRQRGATGAGSSRSALGGALWLESQAPEDLPRGETTSVAYTGGGFGPGLTIVYLLPSELWADPASPEPHPGVSVASLTVVDSEHATADVTVTAGAQGIVDPVTSEESRLPVQYSN